MAEGLGVKQSWLFQFRQSCFTEEVSSYPASIKGLLPQTTFTDPVETSYIVIYPPLDNISAENEQQPGNSNQAAVGSDQLLSCDNWKRCQPLPTSANELLISRHHLL